MSPFKDRWINIRWPPFFNNVTVLILPSRIESIPVILSDALQLDCNLIVTDVGDMGPLVRSYRAGMVVDKGVTREA